VWSSALAQRSWQSPNSQWDSVLPSLFSRCYFAATLAGRWYHGAAVNEVGVVSIVVGVVVVCGRGALLVAPAATLHRFEGV
jgi:hypothetical protein